MPGPVFLEGERICLHTIDRDDLPFLQRWHNDPGVRAGVTLADPRNERQQEEWYESLDDDSIGLLVCPREDVSGLRDVTAVGGDGAEDLAPVGYISLFRVDATHGNAELYCWMVPDAREKGYATDATRTMLRYAFEERRLHKVVCRALETNEASIGVFENLGLVREGRQRDEKYVGGKYVDVFRYAMLADEWDDGTAGAGGNGGN